MYSETRMRKVPLVVFFIDREPVISLKKNLFKRGV